MAGTFWQLCQQHIACSPQAPSKEQKIPSNSILLVKFPDLLMNFLINLANHAQILQTTTPHISRQPSHTAALASDLGLEGRVFSWQQTNQGSKSIWSPNVSHK